jgi:hypothetical protein
MLEYLWEFALFFGLMMGEQLKTVGNSLNKEVLYASKILKFRKLKCYHHSFNHYQNKYMSKWGENSRDALWSIRYNFKEILGHILIA